MYRYLLRRLNLFVLTVLMLLALLYTAARMIPGDLSSNLSGITEPTPAQLAQIHRDYRLDHSLVSGYIAYTQQRLSGELGLSVNTGEPVIDQIVRYLPASIELVSSAIFLAFVLGIPLGVLAAAQRSKIAKLIWGCTLLGFSLPVFWMALLLILSFSVQLDWLPPPGRHNLLYEVPMHTGFLFIDILLSDVPWRWEAIKDALAHLLLPSIVLAILPVTIIVRTLKTAMRSEMEKNYIRALAARGTRKSLLVISHALPNALASLFRTLGLQIGAFTATTIMVEEVFAWPGLGTWILSALRLGDVTALQGGVLIIALFIIVMGILMDILYTLFNPVSRKAFNG